MQSCSENPLDSAPTTSSCSQCQAKRNFEENVVRMLAWRQISPTVKRPAKRLWGDSASLSVRCQGHMHEVTSAKQALISWVEAESFRHSVARYCPLVPAPRSTIAAAFSPDGKTLASTHGDHTVKIICCHSGQCLKVLSGHRRTPWVVRYHPSSPEVLASGSLDYEVRLWNANTADCVGSRDFYRPIASLAFHAQGDILAVASGHKLYIWRYTKEEEPTIVLRTRRSLRAVHFHPLAAPLLLTAEVNDLDSPDCSMSVATPSLQYSHPAPAPQQNQNGSLAGWVWSYENDRHPNSTVPQAESSTAVPMDISPRASNAESGLGAADATDVDGSILPDAASSVPETGRISPNIVGGIWDGPFVPSEQVGGQFEGVAYSSWGLPLVPVARRQEEAGVSSGIWPVGLFPNISSQAFPVGQPQFPPLLNVGDSAGIDLPFLAGWAQNQGYEQPGVEAGNLNSHQDHPPRRTGGRPTEARAPNRMHPRHPVAGFGMEAAASAAAAAELPCTVKLKLWPHDIKNPSALLDPETCLLTIPHAVLCSEMGTHFSPCGRFLAACVACVMETGLTGRGNGTGGYSVQSPTQHPISTQQVIYELRIYSLEKAKFGEVLAAKPVRAAHCLTSIQFSPTSAHILLAYGRRHGSLLRSIVLDGANTIPVYTILEIYRISDLKLVRVLPSAEDEVNVACFHPQVGGGLVYGTKEGKLRIIRRDWLGNPESPSQDLEDQLLEAETSDPLTFGLLPRNGQAS